MLSSISYLDYFQEKENDELKEYILNVQVNNSADWKDIKLGERIISCICMSIKGDSAAVTSVVKMFLMILCLRIRKVMSIF